MALPSGAPSLSIAAGTTLSFVGAKAGFAEFTEGWESGFGENAAGFNGFAPGGGWVVVIVEELLDCG
jgi:hypothetical protein